MLEARDLTKIFQVGDVSVRAVDGVSLTVVESRNGKFSISVIPYTLHNTTIGDLRVGSSVNLEVDLLAKYVEKMMETNVIHK